MITAESVLFFSIYRMGAQSSGNKMPVVIVHLSNIKTQVFGLQM